MWLDILVEWLDIGKMVYQFVQKKITWSNNINLQNYSVHNIIYRFIFTG